MPKNCGPNLKQRKNDRATTLVSEIVSDPQKSKPENSEKPISLRVIKWAAYGSPSIDEIIYEMEQVVERLKTPLPAAVPPFDNSEYGIPPIAENVSEDVKPPSTETVSPPPNTTILEEVQELAKQIILPMKLSAKLLWTIEQEMKGLQLLTSRSRPLYRYAHFLETGQLC